MTFTADQLERYSRHFVLSGVGVSGQKRLLQGKVLVVGAGGLASPVLLYLTGAGVGTLGVVDDDRVSLSNLQRQVLHNTDTVGIEKVDSAEKAIHRLNPDVKVVLHHVRLTPENAQSIITQYDVVVDATDRFTSKLLVNDACVLEGKPYIHAGAVQFSGQIMTYIPHKGPCLRCLMETVPEEQGETCSEAGVLGAAVGVLGSLQATEAIKCLLNLGRPLTGRMLFFNALTMEFKTVAFERSNPNCLVCGRDAVIHSVQENRKEYEQPTGCSSEEIDP